MSYLWKNSIIKQVLSKLSEDNNIFHNNVFYITYKSDKDKEIWFRTSNNFDNITQYKFTYDNFQMLYEGKDMKLQELRKNLYEVVPMSAGEVILKHL